MYDNLITSDHLEQVVQKIQDTKASKSTTLSGYGITDSYTKTETDNRIQDIVGAAPEALDTLEEIAEALQDGESTAAGLVQTLSQKADKSTTVTNIAYGSKKLTKTINGSTTDVVTINAIKSDLALTKSDVGLSNVDNTSDVNKPVSNATQTALDTKVDKVSGKGLSTNDYTTAEKNKLSGIASNAQVNIIESIKVNNSVLPISSKSVNITVPTKTSELTNNSNFAVDSNYVHTDNNYTTAEKQKLASKVAELDNNGKVLSSQLPSYVDDVVEYTSLANFPTTGESGKIYVDTNANLTYRWTGSAYREISPSLALGETSSTAYRGDRGKVAYTHATDSNRLTTAKTSGLYKISTTAEGHVASAETATKSDIGLGNVDNTSDLDKPISTSTQEALNTKVNVTTSVLKSDEEFTYRQTGDGSLNIDAKYGKLKSIKGRTLVWNQLENGTWASAYNLVKSGNTYTLSANAERDTLTMSYNKSFITGHKYFVKAHLKMNREASLSGNFYPGYFSTPTQWVSYGITGESFMVGFDLKEIITLATDKTTLYLGAYHVGTTDKFATTDTLVISNPQVVDLTLMFGAGNEPATAAEFEALYPRPYYRTCDNMLINNGVSIRPEYDLVFNQLLPNGNFSNNLSEWTNFASTISVSNREVTLTKTEATGTGGFLQSTKSGEPSHKYYMSCYTQSDGTDVHIAFHSPYHSLVGNTAVSTTSTTYTRISQITSPVNTTDVLCVRIGAGATPTGVTCKVKNVMLVDLTLMFGTGNEPTTPEEFEAMFPADYYLYDAGTQGHYSFPQFKTKIETVGWNIFDESTFVKDKYRQPSGEEVTTAAMVDRRCSDVFFPCYPNIPYYFYSSVTDSIFGAVVCWYDSEKSYISGQGAGNLTITSPATARFFRVASASPTCKVCISISDPSRNGTYEPYWRSELELGLGDIKVKSHNIWDEEWEAGQYSSSDGTKISSNNNFRSKNPIRIIPGGKYYGRVPSQAEQLRCCTYDSSGNFLGAISGGFFNNTITFGNNVAFIHICTLNGTTPSYANNICINLSDTAFNGCYDPYGDGGVISITGGLKSAGTVFDEISGGKLVKRLESVGLSTLASWSAYDTANSRYNATVSDMRIAGARVAAALIPINNDYFTYQGRIYIETTNSDRTSFIASLAGVPLYYELAQPIEYELYNPIDLSYKVDKFGTEKLLPGSTSAIVSSPFRADIEYRTTNVTIDDVYGGSDIIKSVEDVDSRLTTVEKSINGLVTIGSGSPTTIPKNIGDFYIDVTNKVLYFATGNQLISDWNS